MPSIVSGPLRDLSEVTAATVAASRRSCGAAEHGISRAAFLRGTLATAVIAIAGRRVPAPLGAAAEPAPGLTSIHPALSPLDLRFSTVEQVRPFELLPRRFAQVREWFNSAAIVRRYTGTAVQAEGRPAEVSQIAGALRIRSIVDALTLFHTNSGPVAPYAAVIVTLGTARRSRGTSATIVAGLVRSAHDYVVATFDRGTDPDQGAVSIDLAVDGQRTRVASRPADLTDVTRFAFVVNENYVTALAGGAASWMPIAQARITDRLDLRDPAILSRYRYGFGAGGVGATAEITRLEAGYFGEAGLRDPHVVSDADGTPYIRNNKLYFTATQAGLAFFQAAHWGCGRSISRSRAGSSRSLSCSSPATVSCSAITPGRSWPTNATAAFTSR